MRGAFLDLVQAEAVPERFEARALELLTHDVGAEAAFFSVKGWESAPVVLGIDAEAIARSVQGGSVHERELAPVKRAALAARGVAVDTAVLGESVVRRTKYFREVVARAGGRHSLLAYLVWRGAPRAAVMLGRSGVGFSDHERQRIEAILPELCTARATYGWPALEQPLPQPARVGWLEGWGVRSRSLASVVTPHGSLKVRDRSGFREMVAGEGDRELVWTRAGLARPSRSGWPYVELFHVAAALARERRRALFIGAGGAVAVRQFARAYAGIAIDLVEHDPQVLELARRWFDLASIPGVTVHVADGAELVRGSAAARWNVIIVDAYSDDFVDAFGQRAFFAAARRALTRGGTLAMNVIGTLDGSPQMAAILSNARGELGEPRLLPVLDAEPPYDPSARRNVVVVFERG